MTTIYALLVLLLLLMHSGMMPFQTSLPFDVIYIHPPTLTHRDSRAHVLFPLWTYLCLQYISIPYYCSSTSSLTLLFPCTSILTLQFTVLKAPLPICL
jgi:hypothetical protein